jgi:hypothetical protein
MSPNNAQMHPEEESSLRRQLSGSGGHQNANSPASKYNGSPTPDVGAPSVQHAEERTRFVFADPVAFRFVLPS